MGVKTNFGFNTKQSLKEIISRFLIMSKIEIYMKHLYFYIFIVIKHTFNKKLLFFLLGGVKMVL